MNYISTRGKAPVLNFEEAMLTGLARDGGLYVPQSIPVFSADEIRSMSNLSYEEIAFKVISPFVGDCFSDDELLKIINKAYSHFGHKDRAPLVELETNHFLLELFHGPTLAFKDFAMQLIGQFFQVALERKKSRVTIVGATSGDTGSAAIEAFRGLDAVDVFILYPNGRVSDVQRRQMTTPSEKNVHAIAVDGNFDDCQAHLKDMFNDFEFRDGVKLAGVNSINWARVLAQVVYYFSSAIKLGAPNKKISFSVPTGNFGDIFAGFIAKKMGLSIDRLVIATNQNDILHRCLSSGVYKIDSVLPSISPSMDIQVSSNFERALYSATDCNGSEVSDLMEQLKSTGQFDISGSILKKLRENFDSGMASENETHSEITYNYQNHAELLCPHSAIGVLTARRQRSADIPMVTLATAHPAKFPTPVKNATSVFPELPSSMADQFEREERTTNVENNLQSIQAIVRERI